MTTVGLIGPSDVAVLQDKVARYRFALQASINLMAPPGLPTSGAFSQTSWLAIVEDCKAFEAESSAPWTFLSSGGAYDRGRDLIGRLDGWRDQLANLKAPQVPDPIPVPNADVSFGGATLGVAALFIAYLLFRELKR